MAEVFEYFYPVQDTSCPGPLYPPGKHSHDNKDSIDINLSDILTEFLVNGMETDYR